MDEDVGDSSDYMQISPTNVSLGPLINFLSALFNTGLDPLWAAQTRGRQ